jgi:hypothetical protein
MSHYVTSSPVSSIDVYDICEITVKKHFFYFLNSSVYVFLHINHTDNAHSKSLSSTAFVVVAVLVVVAIIVVFLAVVVVAIVLLYCTYIGSIIRYNTRTSTVVLLVTESHP